METKNKVITPTEGPVDFAFENLLKGFNREVKKLGIIEEVRRRRYYEKPSALRRLKEKEIRRLIEKNRIKNG
jgi:ribosomal protein S21